MPSEPFMMDLTGTKAPSLETLYNALMNQCEDVASNTNDDRIFSIKLWSGASIDVCYDGYWHVAITFDSIQTEIRFDRVRVNNTLQWIEFTTAYNNNNYLGIDPKDVRDFGLIPYNQSGF